MHRHSSFRLPGLQLAGSLVLCLSLAIALSCGGDGGGVTGVNGDGNGGNGGDDGNGVPIDGDSIVLTFSGEFCGLPASDDFDAWQLCHATRLSPGQRFGLRVRLDATDLSVILEARLLLSGLIDRSFPLEPDFDRGGIYSTAEILTVPASSGTITVRGRVRITEGEWESDPVDLPVSSTGTPTLDEIALLPESDTVDAGGQLGFAFTPHATDGVDMLYLVYSGADLEAGAIDVQLANGERHTVQAWVPASAGIGDEITVRVTPFGMDGAAGEAVDIGPWIVWDTQPPSAFLTDLPGYQPYVPGDLFECTLAGSDTHGLTWLGYRFDPPVAPPDSVAVSGLEASVPLTLPIDEAWIGNVMILPFARDSVGATVEGEFDHVLEVLDGIRPAYRNLGLSTGTGPTIRFDPSGELLYLAESLAIHRVDLTSMTGGVAYMAPGDCDFPGGFDLSQAGDPVLLARCGNPTEPFLAWFDGSGPGSEAELLPLACPEGASGHVVVLEDDRVLLAADSWASDPFVWEYDPGTGDQGFRTDAGVGEEFDDNLSLDRSWDGSAALYRWFPMPCCPTEARGQAYLTVTDAFGAPADAGSVNHYSASASSTGDRFLVGGSVIDGQLGRLADLDYPFRVPEGSEEVVSALSPDGATAYFAQFVSSAMNMYHRIVPVDVATGTPGKLMLVPEEIHYLIAEPTGTELIGIGDFGVYVFELP
jgi:hypothetical protein